MPATVTIRLNDQAAPGLKNLQEAFEETGVVAEAASRGMEKLTAEQQRQITVVHEHQGSWLQFAGTLVWAGGAAYGAYAQLASLGKGAGALGTVVTNVNKVGGGLATTLGAIATKGRTALPVIALVTGGIGITVVAATAAVVAIKTLGSSALKLNEHFRQSEKATDSQRKKFTELQREAKELGVSIEEAARRAGVSLDDLAVKVDSSYQQISDAGDRLLVSYTNLTGGVIRANLDVLAEMSGLRKAWDGSVSWMEKKAKQLAETLDNITETLDQLADWRLGEGYSELARVQAEWAKNAEATAENFKRMREANELLAKSSEAADRSRKISALSSIEAIESEMQAVKSKFGELAAARQFDEAAQKEYIETFQALERRKTQIVEEQTRERLRREAEAAKELQRIERETAERYREYQGERIRQVIELRSNLERNQTAQRLAGMEAESRAQLAALDLQESRLLAVGGTEIEQEKIRLQMLQQRQKATVEADQKIYDSRKDEITEAAKKELAAIDEERDRRMELVDSVEDKQKIADEARAARAQAAFQTATQLAQAETDFKIQQYDRELAAKAELEAAKERIERARLDRTKAFLEEQGVTGEKVLNAQDPKKVLRDIQEQRRKQALDQFNQSDRGKELNQQAQNDPRARRRLAEEQKRIQQQAGRQAYRDAQTGNLAPGELQQAQLNVAKQQLDTMEQNQQLNGTMADGIKELAQTNAQHQATIETLREQMDHMRKLLQGQGRSARAQRERAQKGSL